MIKKPRTRPQKHREMVSSKQNDTVISKERKQSIGETPGKSRIEIRRHPENESQENGTNDKEAPKSKILLGSPSWGREKLPWRENTCWQQEQSKTSRNL